MFFSFRCLRWVVLEYRFVFASFFVILCLMQISLIFFKNWLVNKFDRFWRDE